ncbi:electron transfer flavoprotein subunit beta/FixA family protein [Rothia sp. ZJ932]|nr:electron transfer flavoprotein subunit beta/FixA family protein [Rothia sp. ZJ1223]QRZ62618.1 electron transfer flavoprotein subunit beta/FixA family protein [Rothia sp. ZJ932]
MDHLTIAVLVKYVPDTQFDQTIDAEELTVNREESVMSELDEYAVEAALQITEKHQGEHKVVAFAMGPASASKGLRRALQLGADEGVLLSDEALAGSDAAATARALAAGVKHWQKTNAATFDMVLTGMASTDGETSLVPAQLAELLELPLLTNVASLELSEQEVSARRDLDDISQELHAPVPFIASVTDQINTPRYPNFKAIMAAKKKPIITFTLDDLDLDPSTIGRAGSWVLVEDAKERAERTAGEIITDDGDAGVQLADFLASRNLI